MSITCPEHLSETARTEWNRITIEQRESLTSADTPALAAYCTAYARWIEAEQQIQKSGTVVKTSKDSKPVPNPYLAVSKQALDIMRDFLTLLQHKATAQNTVF